MFAAGENVVTGELSLEFDPADEITIEDVELREFVEPALAAV